MTQYFDTHAHYDSGKFNADREEVLRAVHESGVALIVDPGDCAATSARAVAIAQEYDFVYAAVGWHPEEAAGWTDDSLEQIRALAAQPKVCAIGEIGLDYYWDASTKATQEIMLRAQLELALELDLPVIIHDREAHGDSLRIVCDYPGLRGVFHCFSGSVEMARELLRRGWYLTPVPNRGKRNDSRNLPYIAARIAEIKGMTTEEVAEVTLQNGKQLFGL